MASELDDLNFEIKGNIATTMDALKDLGKKLDSVFEGVERIDVAFRNLGHAMGLPAAQIELLTLRIQPLVNTLDKAQKQADSLEESFTRKLMQKALEDHAKKVVVLADGTQRARYEMIRLAEASQQLRIPTQAPKAADSGGTGQSSGGVNFVRVTAAAAQLSVLARVSSTMRTVGQSMAQVGEASQITASHMTRFRMGLQAVPVNPALNVVKNSLDAIGGGAAKTIDTLRGVADAILSDLPGAASAAVGAMGSVNSALDSTSATASKHVSQLHKMQGSLSLLATVFPFAADQIAKFRAPLDVVTAKAEGVANKIDEMNATVATSASEMRGAAYVMTGSFQQMAGSADLFSRSQYYALLPTRLLFREFEGGQRIVKVATRGFELLTRPIHAVTLAIGQGRAEWQDLNNRLPKLTGGLQIATRAQRLFAQSAYVVGTSVRSVVTLMTPLVKVTALAAKGIWSLVSPAKAAATSLAKLTGVQNTFIGKALGMKSASKQAADSLGQINKASAKASSGFGGLSSKASMATTMAAGLMAGMVAMGTQTAIATEKNNAVFGTMLHDMGQGKAVVDSLQNTQAAKFFDNQELLQSGVLLYKAGVSASQLADKTDQFAKISAATSTELGDLTRIYQQGANAGSFGQDKINQYAERGIAIYDGLATATGKSGAELKKMISDGKIGVAEMDVALAHLTTGHGIYADSLNNLAGTTSGKMSEVKNNVSQGLGAVMGIALQLLQPFGTAVVTMSQQLKAGFDSFRAPIIYAATAVAWFFGNFVNLGKFAFTTFALMSVTAFNDFIYFFTTKIPAYLNWFSQNWRQVFTDAGNLIVTVFANIAKNIGSAMSAIWNFIKSGGTAELQFAFVPLLDGFKATVSELPDIPDRAMTDLEKKLNAQAEQLGGNLANNFDKMLADAEAQVAEATPAIIDNKDQKNKTDETAAKAADRAVQNRAATVRSSEGQSVVAQFAKALGKDGIEKRAQKAQIDAAKDLHDIRRSVVRNGKPLTGKQWN